MKTPTISRTRGSGPSDSPGIELGVFLILAPFLVGAYLAGRVCVPRSRRVQDRTRRVPRLVRPVVIALGGSVLLFGGTGAYGTSSAVDPYRSTVLADGPASYWRLGEVSGTVATDEQGQNSGSYQAGVTLNQPGALQGSSDKSALFDGSTGYVTIPDSNSLDVGDAFTMEAWVKRTQTGLSTGARVVHKGNGPPSMVVTPSDRLSLVQGGGATVVTSTLTIPDTSSWHYLVITKSGSTVRLYIDAADATGTVTNVTMSNNGTAQQIGRSATGANYFPGYVDEVASYNYPLTADRILAHYQAAVSPPVAPTNTSPPIIGGTPQDGQTLSANPGSWSGSAPISYAFQWRRCDSGGASCVDIPTATGSSYTLATADIGKTVRLAVTASNGAGSSAATSAQTAVVTAAPPANTSPPTISGTPQDGQTLSANPGSWSGTAPISYAYQWRWCTSTGSPCTDIPGATSQLYVVTSTAVAARMQVAVTASNAAGTAAALSAPTAVVAPLSSPPGDPVIAAAGDIACDPTNPDYNGGAGNANECRQRYTSNLLVGAGLAGVLPLGDNQYECGGYSAFLASYDPSWGRLKAITHPAAGNHEYNTSGGTDCDNSGKATGYFTYFGAAAGDPKQGYYSFDVGGWHIIALNTNCAKSFGCHAGSKQEMWLKADLAAHPATCTLAYWHHPRFSSVASSTAPQNYWKDLSDARAEIVLSGHVHNYERFAPQSPTEAYDPANGIREFVVGTGGQSLQPFSTAKPLSEARQKRFGVLKLTLHAAGYDWEFLPDIGGPALDSGSAACH